MTKTSAESQAWNVHPAGFALLRTPLKPISFMPEHATDGVDAEQSLRSRLRQLAECLRDPIALAAIAHASASLGSRAHMLDPEDLGKDNLKLGVALYKYVMRFSRRSTPFGLMAAVSTLEVGSATRIQVEPDIRLHARLDNAYTARFARQVREALLRTRNCSFRVYVNNTSQLLTAELRRVTRVGSDGDRYRLSAVRRTPEIDLIFNEVADGIQSGQLVVRMCELLACDEDEAWGFLESLISREVLYTGVELALTSGDCFGALGRAVAAIEKMEDEATSLGMLHKQMQGITGIDGTLEEHICHATESVSRLLGEEPELIVNPIHFDAYRHPGQSTVGHSELQELAKNIALLLPVLWRPYEPLQTFSRAFTKRFGDAEVPLLEALDADTGIGFGPPRAVSNPLLSGVLSRVVPSKFELEWNVWRQFLLNRIQQAATRGEEEILISQDELARYGRSPIRQDMALSLAVHVSLLGTRDENGSPSMLLKSFHGPSAANLLGRFTCGDADLAALVRELASHEQALVPGRLAEVLHVPVGKAANVLTRTCLRDTEILYGPVNASGSQALTCADLLVSVREGRLHLRSRLNGDEILPRLASAHFTGAYNLPVYQFLAAMQYVDGHVGSVIDSKLFEFLPHIPRVRVGSLVVSPARWRIEAGELEPLARKGSVKELMTAANALRFSRGMPRQVALVQGDNLLDIDLEDPLAVLALAAELKGKPAILFESMAALDRGGVSIDGKAAANELIVPMHVSVGKPGNGQLSTSNMPTAIAAMRDSKERPLERWVYLEVFTGESSVERMLADVIAPCMRSLQDDGRLAKWFYVRYYDGEDFHLRLRLLPKKEEDRLSLADSTLRLFDRWIEDGIVSQVRICGYEPEVERYGGLDSMPFCEEIFHLHSEVVAKVLKSILGSPDQEDRRWLACAVLVWETLRTVYPDLAKLANFAATMVQSYRREMPESSETARAVSLNYRAHREALESAIDEENHDRALEPIVDSHARALRRAALQSLTSMHDQERLAGIVASLVHMDCNRIFPFKPRANEMMIYEYLGRYARSRFARAQESQAAVAPA